MSLHMYQPQGIAQAAQIFAKSSWFLVYYDPDIDGAISGELVRRFLSAFGKTQQYYINENRTHGLRLTEDQLTQLVGATLVLVDAGMTKDEVLMLTARGINVVNIDHHHLPYQDLVYVQDATTGAEGVIINNQYPFEPEHMRFLSGAGVVYYVLNAFYDGFCGLDEKALVGLSLLSDIRPLENEVAQDFLHTTFTHQSEQMTFLLEATRNERDFGFGQLTFDRNFIDYTFSPKVNALFRLNKGHEAVKLFQAGLGGPTDPRFQEILLADIRSQLDVLRKVQNAIVDHILKDLVGHEEKSLIFKSVPSDLNLAYKYELTNFIGLACSRVKNVGKTTFLYVSENGQVKRGSVRGMCDDVDYLEIFRKHGFRCEGHKNAFGVISVDFSSVDVLALDAAIEEAERGYQERRYVGRVLDVANLGYFLQSPNVRFADHNNYVRDPYRIFLKYTGSSVEVNKKGRATEFNIDGIRVMSFEEGLTLEEAFILPVRERGEYINFYLKRA